MSESARAYLIAYDISNDRVRLTVSHYLQSYGDRIQYSVFLLDVKPATLIGVRRALTKMIDLTSDSVLVCDMGASVTAGRRLATIGRPRAQKKTPVV